jgi:hypothetical protein
MTNARKDTLRRSQIFANPKPSQMAILFTGLLLKFLLFLTPQRIKCYFYKQYYGLLSYFFIFVTTFMSRLILLS